MFRRISLWLAVTTAAAVAATVAALPGTAAASTTNPGVGLMALRGGDFSAAAQPGRYDVIVLGQPSDWAQIPALKAANPALKVFLYKDVQATSDDQVTGGVDDYPLTTGVGYEDALHNHPDWFALSTSGARVPFDDYAGDWWMDVGNAGYQNAWAANVAADVKKFGADGVMMDDVNAAFGYHLPSGTTLAGYATDAAWASAQESFLNAVVPQLHAAGVQAIANIMEPWSTTWEPLWKRWIAATDGVLYEYWTKYGHDSTLRPLGGAEWAWEMQRADDVTSAGKIFVPVTYGDMSDAAAQTYSRASFLLTWTGGLAGQTWSPTTTNTDAWNPVWTMSVGAPTAPRTQVGTGVWRRSFASGTVVVNSTASTVTVPLGSTFRTAGGTEVTSVTLAPASAAILTTAASAPTAPDSTPTSTTTAVTTPTDTSSATTAPAPVATNDVVTTTVVPAPSDSTAPAPIAEPRDTVSATTAPAQAAPTQTTVARRVLRRGMHGADVKRVQRLLHVHADGVYGKRTVAAVKRFQRRHHLRASGVTTSRTWAALLRLHR